MTLPSKAAMRTRERGFSLLEALIAIAIVALAMGAVMVTLSRLSVEQRDRLDRLQLTEFASSKLEEWAFGGSAATDATGTATNGWSWDLSEVAFEPDPVSTMNASMSYGRVTVRVWKSANPSTSIELSTVVARRRR